MGVADILAMGVADILANTLAACALVISVAAFFVSRSSLRIADSNLRIADSNLRIADRAARNDVVAQLRSWGDEVVDLLSEAAELCGAQVWQSGVSDFVIRRSHLAANASALLDRGRFFFAKIDRGNFGMNKPPAYQGYRPPILDLLFLTFSIIRRMDPKPEPIRRRGLIHLQREFVSVIQFATGPSAPLSLGEYEAFLGGVPVKTLPEEILTLSGAGPNSFEIKFDPAVPLSAAY
jgi:hypothetical protein